MFIVLHISTPPEHLSGYLSRFLIEPLAGVYVGRLSPRVATAIWERTCEAIEGTGAALMVASDESSETGFRMSVHGDRTYSMVESDGLQLISH